MVDSGEYLWQCLKYVELNMVRCGVVRHPRDWQWSGYGELMGLRKRNRLLDVEKLLWLLRVGEVEEFRVHLDSNLAETIAKDQLKREAKWTEALAVGSGGFVEQINANLVNRRRTECKEETGTWVLREADASFFGAKNEALGRFAETNLR